jgi:hypothetical protein
MGTVIPRRRGNVEPGISFHDPDGEGARGTGSQQTSLLLRVSIVVPSSEGFMKTAIACLVVTLALFGTSSANAKGCIKGAIVGGVAGHYAAHHGMLGAAAGCLYGRHHAKEQERQQQQQNQANGQGKI